LLRLPLARYAVVDEVNFSAGYEIDIEIHVIDLAVLLR
jgi:hypothetical protein